MKSAILEGIRKRMVKLVDDSNLVYATVLDPRYKMEYFAHIAELEQEKLRIGLKIEIEHLIRGEESDSSSEEADSQQPFSKSTIGSYFAGYESQHMSQQPKPKRPRNELEARHRADRQVRACFAITPYKV